MRDVLIFVILVALIGASLVGWRSFNSLEAQDRLLLEQTNSEIKSISENIESVSDEVDRMRKDQQELIISLAKSVGQSRGTSSEAGANASQDIQKGVGELEADMTNKTPRNPVLEAVEPEDIQKETGETLEKYRERAGSKIQEGAEISRDQLEESDREAVRDLGNCVIGAATGVTGEQGIQPGLVSTMNECRRRIQEQRDKLERDEKKYCESDSSDYDEQACESVRRDIDRVDHAEQMMRMMMLFAAVAALASGNPVVAMMIMSMMNQGGDDKSKPPRSEEDTEGQEEVVGTCNNPPCGSNEQEDQQISTGETGIIGGMNLRVTDDNRIIATGNGSSLELADLSSHPDILNDLTHKHTVCEAIVWSKTDEANLLVCKGSAGSDTRYFTLHQKDGSPPKMEGIDGDAYSYYLEKASE